MGVQSSKGSSVIDTNFLKSLTLSTPLKKTQQDETEVHEIVCVSHQHQQIMLDKIRIKKNYDCPYIIKIIDSHTLESKSLCSTIIKTYIVVQKPQSLANEIQQRVQLKMGFEQAQIWTLIYSCCLGASYLIKNNVSLARLTPNKIFIDVKGGIKIIDPDLSQGALPSERISEQQFVYDLSKISRQLLKFKVGYSDSLHQLIYLMTRESNTLNNIQNWIKIGYIDKKKWKGTIEVFSSAKKSKKSKSKQKKMIKVTSNKKNSNSSVNNINLEDGNQIGEFPNFQSLSSYRFGKENKQMNRSINQRNKNMVELFTFKDPLKDMENVNKQIKIESHLFPRKALFGGRSKNSEKLKQTASQQKIQGSQSSIRQSHKQVLTRESNSVFLETDPSLDENQIMNMISYQVDQETFVRQICQQQSYYFLQLMNQCKSSSKSSRN